MNRTDSRARATGVIYGRVSSKDQEKEGFSIPAQLRLLRQYATSVGLRVEEEYVDVETAKRAGRQSFGTMVAFLKRHPSCRVILVEKTDRLYRNLKDWVTLDELDLEIHFVKENVIVSPSSRSSEKLMHGIKVLMAKNYIDNLSEETRKGMLEKAEQGIWPSYAPLGYCNVMGPNGKKTIEPDPGLSPLITRLFEWYGTGQYSLLEVTRLVRRAGMGYRKSGATPPKSVIHKILRNRIYTGDFDWDGMTYRGFHQPLVSRELWEHVQGILDGRVGNRRQKAKHDFAFSGIIRCGHCGCALVGEMKKGRYVYYHCTGYRGKCPEPYTREEILEQRFSALLKGLSMDAEVLEWASEALRQSHRDEKRFHDQATARLQAEYSRLQDRIDAMYLDKLDGRIDAAFFDRKAAEWREEQDRLLRTIEQHQTANQNYLEEGIRLLELAHRAPELFERQQPQEKRRLLDFVLSNSTWKGGELTTEFRQPFDLLYVVNRNNAGAGITTSGSEGRFENWLPRQDSNLQPFG